MEEIKLDFIEMLDFIKADLRYDTEIAREIDYSANTIWHWRKKKRIPSRRAYRTVKKLHDFIKKRREYELNIQRNNTAKEKQQNNQL